MAFPSLLAQVEHAFRSWCCISLEAVLALRLLYKPWLSLLLFPKGGGSGCYIYC